MKAAIFASILLVLLVSAECIRWTGSDGVKRSIRVVRSPPTAPYTFEVRATRNDIAAKKADAIDFLFSVNWVPRFVLRYFQKDSDADTGSALLARWSLWKLIEYTESPSGVDGYEPGTDTKNSEFTLWLRSWSILDYTQTPVGDATVHTLCSTLTPVSGPDVELCLHATTEVTTANATRLSPNSVKWSIDVLNYPYTVTGSRLALKASFDTKDAIRSLADTDQADADTDASTEGSFAVDASSENTKAAILAAWTKTVELTGAGCAATANVVNSTAWEGQVSGDVDVSFPNTQDDDNLGITRTLRVVYWSVITDCQPTRVFWDPEFGVAGVGMVVPSLLVAVFAFFFALF